MLGRIFRVCPVCVCEFILLSQRRKSIYGTKQIGFASRRAALAAVRFRANTVRPHGVVHRRWICAKIRLGSGRRVVAPYEVGRGRFPY